jgi:hypothetical protein
MSVRAALLEHIPANACSNASGREIPICRASYCLRPGRDFLGQMRGSPGIQARIPSVSGLIVWRRMWRGESVCPLAIIGPLLEPAAFSRRKNEGSGKPFPRRRSRCRGARRSPRRSTSCTSATWNDIERLGHEDVSLAELAMMDDLPLADLPDYTPLLARRFWMSVVAWKLEQSARMPRANSHPYCTPESETPSLDE